MNRMVIPVPLGDGTTRWTLSLDGVVEDDWSNDSSVMETSLRKFLQTIVNQPLLLQCGKVIPETFAICYDGRRWTLRAETISEDV